MQPKFIVINYQYKKLRAVNKRPNVQSMRLITSNTDSYSSKNSHHKQEVNRKTMKRKSLKCTSRAHTLNGNWRPIERPFFDL